MKATKTAYTLVEMLCVIAIISALLALLLPGLSRIREEGKRTVCMANERGIGAAFFLYAKTVPEVFPAIAQTYVNDGSDNMRLFYSADRTAQPTTTGIPSPTVDLWAVVRPSFAVPRQFVCPSTLDAPDPAVDVTAYYDFLGPANLSYAYQYQHDPNRQTIGLTSEAIFPVLADANPYIKGGITAPLSTDRTGPGRGNSVNHANREGQNVLFQDGHVVFEAGPDVGLSGKFQTSSIPYGPRGRDNCYTTHVVNSQVDWGNDPPTYSGSSGLCDLGDKSDACLVP